MLPQEFQDAINIFNQGIEADLPLGGQNVRREYGKSGIYTSGAITSGYKNLFDTAQRTKSDYAGKLGILGQQQATQEKAQKEQNIFIATQKQLDRDWQKSFAVWQLGEQDKRDKEERKRQGKEQINSLLTSLGIGIVTGGLGGVLGLGGLSGNLLQNAGKGILTGLPGLIGRENQQQGTTDLLALLKELYGTNNDTFTSYNNPNILSLRNTFG